MIRLSDEMLVTSPSPHTHPLHRDHPAMQLGPVKVADTLGCFLCGWHGDKPVAASPGTFGIGHHLSSDNLQDIYKAHKYLFLRPCRK